MNLLHMKLELLPVLLKLVLFMLQTQTINKIHVIAVQTIFKDF